MHFRFIQVREGISQEWLVLFACEGCFHVSGERGVPADSTGEYPEVLLSGEDQEGGAVYLFGYGEKVKAYLRRRARPLPGFTEYPNLQVGWGHCV